MDVPDQPYFLDDKNATLVFPVLLHYQQYSMTEVIAHFAEDHTFFQQFDVMFPPNAASPPWDKNQEYVNDGRLVVYAITRKQRLLKVGKKMTLRNLFEAAGEKKNNAGRDGLELTQGFLNVVVVLKGLVEENFVAAFKRSRDQ